MRNVFLILGLTAFLPLADAGTLNLASGDVVSILPNVMTTVSCSSDGTPGKDCSDAISTFELIMKTCQERYGGGDCARVYWPQFKNSNPPCKDKGLKTCLESCKRQFNGADCLRDICPLN